MEAPVRIKIPSSPTFVGIVRLAVSSLARQAGMDEERVDDIRIVVSEACNSALATARAGGVDELSVSWLPEGGSIHLEVDGAFAADEARLDEDALEPELSSELIRSLADGYQQMDRDGVSTLRLSFDR